MRCNSLSKQLIDSSDIEKVLESTGLDNTRAALPARKIRINSESE